MFTMLSSISVLQQQSTFGVAFRNAPENALHIMCTIHTTEFVGLAPVNLARPLKDFEDSSSFLNIQNRFSHSCSQL